MVRAFLIVGALAGCYVYAPAPAGRLPDAGDNVRVALTDAGTSAMAPLLGDGVGFIDGRLQSVADTAVTLSVTGTTARSGTSSGWNGEKVSIRRDYVANFQRQVLSRSRSAGLGAVALVAAAASYAVFRGVAKTTAGGGGGPGGGHR